MYIMWILKTDKMKPPLKESLLKIGKMKQSLRQSLLKIHKMKPHLNGPYPEEEGESWVSVWNVPRFTVGDVYQRHYDVTQNGQAFVYTSCLLQTKIWQQE